MSDLPDGWEWTTLGEIAEVRLGRQRSPKNHRGTHMRPYIRAANVGWDGLKLDDVKQMNFTDEEAETYRLRNGDILLSEASGSVAEVGKPAIWNGEIAGCCFQNTLIRVRPFWVHAKFLLWLLKFEALRGAFVEHSRGVGIHHIGSTRLANWPIPLPPLAEQRRIVATLEGHLSRLDNSVNLATRTLERLGQFRDRVLLAAASGSLVERLDGGCAAPPDPVGVNDGELPSVPATWVWRRLGDFADVVGGVTKDTKKQSDLSLPEVPYLRVANIQRGQLNLDEIAKIRIDPVKAERLYLEYGDVLLNEGGDRDKLGRGWIWEGQIDQCIHQNHVFRARVVGDAIHPKLLAWHANGFGKDWFFANGKQSVNLASISLSKVKMLPVPVPPHDEQQSLVETAEQYLSMFDKTEHLLARILSRATHLRRGLLCEAFAGRLVEQNPNDEPASALLERIQAERESVTQVGRKRGAKEPAPKTTGGDDAQVEPAIDSTRPLPETVGQGTQGALDFEL